MSGEIVAFTCMFLVYCPYLMPIQEIGKNDSMVNFELGPKADPPLLSDSVT